MDPKVSIDAPDSAFDEEDEDIYQQVDW
jgi:hypothetical protein